MTRFLFHYFSEPAHPLEAVPKYADQGEHAFLASGPRKGPTRNRQYSEIRILRDYGCGGEQSGHQWAHRISCGISDYVRCALQDLAHRYMFA
jgi:hypothetical protein